MSPQPMSPELMQLATRGPQVETLGDAFTRMRAQQQALAEGKQRLTLGDLATEEGRLKLDQARRDIQNDAKFRDLFNPPPAAQTPPGQDDGQVQPGGGMPGQSAPASPAAPNAPPNAQSAPSNASAPAAGLPPAGPPPGAPAPPQSAPAPAQQQAAQAPPLPSAADVYRIYGSRGAAVLEAMTKAQSTGADLAKKRGEVDVQTRDYEGSLAQMVKTGGNTPQVFEQAMQMLEGHGHPQEAAQLRQMVAQNPAQLPALMEQAIANSPEQQKLVAENTTANARKKTAETGAATAEAKLPGEQAQAAQLVRSNAAAQLAQAATQGPEALASALDAMPHGIARQFAGAKTPADFLKVGQTAEQQVQATQAAINATNTEADRKITQQQGAGRLSVEQQRLKMQQEQAGYEMGGGISATAKAIAAGDLDALATRQALRKNPGLISQIKQVDPNFSELNIDKRQDVLKEFTASGNTKAGGQVIALNTLIHHADLYMQAGEALKNGSFVPGNAIYNKVAQTFGAAPPGNAALLARFFAGETGKVATGGVPAEGEINGILAHLGTNASPDQIVGAGKTLLGIAAGRMTPLQEKVDDAKLNGMVRVIGPDAAEILTRRGFDPKTMKPAAAAPKPATGATVDGYMFLGGDPADPKRWKKNN